MPNRICRVWLLSTGLLYATGCGQLSYLAQLAEGQFKVQANIKPIEDVLAAGVLSEEDSRKLHLVVQAREFAARAIGLRVGQSYTTFYDTSGDPLAWNLSAARADALLPKTWTFPVVGTVPYLAFFDQEQLVVENERLIAAGYDTMSYELDAYSTLGIFADPVRSPMLQRGTLSLVETIIHELLHNTVWRANSTVFNESLATFVGRQGAIEFLTAEFGPESGWAETAQAYYADLDAVNTFLMSLYWDLDAFYSSDVTRDAKIAGREAVFQAARERFAREVRPQLNFPDLFGGYDALPTNNAWILANYRYNLNLDVFSRVYQGTGRDWATTLAVFKAAASAADDPFEYLRQWQPGE